ncbi:MAG: transcriptional repressor [Ruminiclostridium sp.]|nr:transcriptional repressor [Ruminiclostridium sp.]
MAVYKTVQRQMLLDFLKAHPGQTLTVKEITAGIAENAGSAPSESTIYRLMRELVESGTVKKDVNVESRENVYYLAESGDSGVSMRCRVCGNVYSVDDESSRRIKDEISRCGTALPDDNIEFIIKCKKCGR